MAADSISRAEFEEYKRREDGENKRQNQRLERLERVTEQIHALNSSVEKLALGITQMADEQKRQGRRLETLESRDGEKWRFVVSHVVATAIGAFITYIFARLGV